MRLSESQNKPRPTRPGRSAARGNLRPIFMFTVGALRPALLPRVSLTPREAIFTLRPGSIPLNPRRVRGCWRTSSPTRSSSLKRARNHPPNLTQAGHLIRWNRKRIVPPIRRCVRRRLPNYRTPGRRGSVPETSVVANQLGKLQATLASPARAASCHAGIWRCPRPASRAR